MDFLLSASSLHSPALPGAMRILVLIFLVISSSLFGNAVLATALNTTFLSSSAFNELRNALESLNYEIPDAVFVQPNTFTQDKDNVTASQCAATVSEIH